MSDNSKFFAEKYDKAVWHTVRTVFVAIILSIVSMTGLWNLSLAEIREQIEIASQLLERWESHRSTNLEALLSGSPEEKDRAEQYRNLLKEHQVKTPAELKTLIQSLEDKFNGEYQRIGLSVFGVQFVWKDLIITRWLALAASVLLLCLFLKREKELLGKGIAIAKGENALASLYARCTLCPLLISPYELEANNKSFRWRNFFVCWILATPFLVFSASIAYFFFKANRTSVPHLLYLSNIIFAGLFTVLLSWSLKTYHSNVSTWDEWWQLARDEQKAIDCEGSWSFEVVVDEPEMKNFSHQGVAEIHKNSVGFEASGTSLLENGGASSPIRCPWDSAHAVLIDRKLLLMYQFRHLGQQFRAQAEIEVNPHNGNSMAGTYFQLMPVLHNTHGRVSFTRLTDLDAFNN